MLKRVIIILIIISSLGFYQLIFIPDFIVKSSDWIGISLILVFSVLYLVYGQEALMKQHFAFPIALILISVIVSMIGALQYQGQSFMQTAYGQRVIYFYFIYFLLHFMKVSGRFLVRTIIVFAFIYAVLYLIQYMVFPRMITTSKMFLNRGTLRIFIAGGGYLVLSYFIWLYLAFEHFRLRYLLWLILSLVIFILLGTRQLLAAILLLTIFFILRSKVVKSRALFLVLAGLAGVSVFFIFQDVILALLNVTKQQSRNIEGNIRIEAIRYFMTDFYHHKLAYFTGNGAPGRSAYRLRMANIAEEHGFFQSDIGLIGEFTKYGALYVIGVLMIMVRALRARLPEKLMFIKYNFLGILLTMFTAAGAFGSNTANILINCMLLYLIDLHAHDPASFDAVLEREKPVAVQPA